MSRTDFFPGWGAAGTRTSGRKTFLDQRLRELERESESVRDDIRTLNRRLRKAGLAPVDSLSPAAAASQRAAATHAAGRDESRADDEHDLFSWREPPARAETPRPEPAAGGPTSNPAGSPARMPAPPDERLINYLAAGSFVPSAGPKVTEPIRRRRLVFLGIVVVVAGFVVLQLVRLALR